jgi:hypothetical protein
MCGLHPNVPWSCTLVVHVSQPTIYIYMPYVVPTLFFSLIKWGGMQT